MTPCSKIPGQLKDELFTKRAGFYPRRKWAGNQLTEYPDLKLADTRLAGLKLADIAGYLHNVISETTRRFKPKTSLGKNGGWQVDVFMNFNKIVKSYRKTD